MKEAKMLNTKDINLNQGDCMKAMRKMKENEYDLAIVDPPYGLGMRFAFDNGICKSNHKVKNWNNKIPSKQYFLELHRVTKNQIVWGCNYFNKYIDSVGRIVHNKEMKIEGTMLNFIEADIASCSLQKRITMFNYRWSGNKQGRSINWKNTGTDKRIHPTQKPVALMEYLIKTYTNEGETVLDFTMGSGTTGVACVNTCRDFIGIEMDEGYFNIAKERTAT